MSLIIKIPLAKSYCVVSAFNVSVFVMLSIYMIMATPIAMPTADMIFMLFFMMLVCLSLGFPPKESITHLLLNEGETNACKGSVDCKNNAQNTLVMLESYCRVTPFGCWLAFDQQTQIVKQGKLSTKISGLNIWRKPNRKWIFVPRFLLSEAHYKAICRHLIWHTQ